MNALDTKEQNLQSSEIIHPEDRSKSKNHSDNSTSANINHIKETENDMENTDLNDTTSHTEPNKATEEISPTPNTDGPIEK